MVGLTNCRNKQNCPLNGKCLESSIVYEAVLKAKYYSFNYLGMTTGIIKDRTAKQKTSFKHPRYGNNTELSKKGLGTEKSQLIEYFMKRTIKRYIGNIYKEVFFWLM